MAVQKKKDQENFKALHANERKWTKTLMEPGWTVIPSVILERQKALGLDALDLNIIMQLARYWWIAENKPFPAKKTIAECVGVHPRTVQRRIEKLENDGLIRREERRIKGQGSKTNIYHFDGLIKAATPFAEEAIEDIKQRLKEDKERPARKGKPNLKAVK